VNVLLLHLCKYKMHRLPCCFKLMQTVLSFNMRYQYFVELLSDSIHHLYHYYYANVFLQIIIECRLFWTNHLKQATKYVSNCLVMYFNSGQHVVNSCLKKLDLTQKNPKQIGFFLNADTANASWCSTCFVLFCACFCTSHFVTVSLNLTCIQCL